MNIKLICLRESAVKKFTGMKRPCKILFDPDEVETEFILHSGMEANFRRRLDSSSFFLLLFFSCWKKSKDKDASH
jgi:hypothetical protein